MKKLLFIALIGYGWAHNNGYSLLPKDGAFDKDGNAIIRVFVGRDCGRPCTNQTEMLTARRLNFELIDISSPRGQELGIQYPLTMIGDKKVLNSDDLVSTLIETYGQEVLSDEEKRVISGHFDASGKPKVVMYGTAWCGACKAQRKYFADNSMEFEDIDVEKSADGRVAFDTLQGGGYPLTYVGYRRFSGFKAYTINEALAKGNRQKGWRD